MTITEAAAAAFWPRVNKTDDGCWEWTGPLNDSGYGIASIGFRKRDRAHRVAWTLTNGAVPDDMCVLHRCDNRRCVRPGHLFLGTRGDNARDMASKGRQWLQKNPQAIAGENNPRHKYLARHPRKPRPPCRICVQSCRRAWNGRCQACASYLNRTGAERPAHLFTAIKES